MANYDHTILQTKNPDVLRAVIDLFTEMNNGNWYYQNHELLSLAVGEKGMGVSGYHQLPPDVQKTYLNAITDIHLKSRNDVFHDQTIELSKQFSEDKITCKYTHEHDWHFIETTVEYLNGKDTVIGQVYKPALMADVDLEKLIGENESKAVLQKIGDFVMALYDKKLFHEGETITYDFIHNQYKFVVTIPFGPHYNLTVYRGNEVKKTVWQKMVNDSELPF